MRATCLTVLLLLAGCSGQEFPPVAGETYTLVEGEALSMNGPPEAGLPGGVLAPPSQLRMPNVASKDDPLVAAPQGAIDSAVSFVELCVDDGGVPTEVRLLASSGIAMLDEAAVNLVRQSKLKPASLDGKPVAYCGHVFPIRWNIPHQR